MQQSDPKPSDAVIINAVLAGDTERFSALVDRYQQALLRLAHSRLGRADWAEEVVQESLLCAFRSLSSYDSRFSFRTWLWTIVLNQCRRCYQRNQRVPRVQSWSDQSSEDRLALEPRHAPSSEVTPEMSFLVRERSRLLETLLRKLPDTQADALRLRFFGGLKFQEIADTMDSSLSTAKNRVKAGLVTLSRLLGDETKEAGQTNVDRGDGDDAPFELLP